MIHEEICTYEVCYAVIDVLDPAFYVRLVKADRLFPTKKELLKSRQQ